MQRGMGRSLSMSGAFDSVSPLFQELVRRTGSKEILDLCSGSGEAVVELWQSMIATFPEDERPKH